MNARTVFRTLDRLNDSMIRATMPRIAAADPLPESRAAVRVKPTTAPKPLTYTLAEVPRA